MAVTDVGTMTYDGPLPGAGQYGVYQTGVQAAYQNALAQTQNSRSQFSTQQGISLGDNGTWSITGGAGANTGAQQELSGDAQAGISADAGMANLGFGGGVANQQRETAHNAISQHAADWATGVMGQLNDYNTADTDATKTMGTDLYNGLMSDITSAIQNGTFNPANYTGITIPGMGDISSILSGLPVSTAPGTSGNGGDFNAGGSAGSGSGGTGGSAHPHYAAYQAGGGKMTYKQWLASGRPGHRG